MSTGTGTGNIVSRRPAESATLTAGIAAFVIAKLLHIEDPDVLLYLPVCVGAVPGVVTALADWIARTWGRNKPPE